MLVLMTLLAFGDLGRTQRISDEVLRHPNWRLLDRKDDCGHSFSDRIIGGEAAKLGQYPWIARLQYSLSFPDYYSEPTGEDEYTAIFDCGGSIISERYILTAAHCGTAIMMEKNLKLEKVRLGEHDIRTEIDCEGKTCAPEVQDIAVEKETCHKQYSNQTLHNDICLLRLATPIKFNDFVSPICLPVYQSFLNNTFEGIYMEVAGFGVIDIVTGAGSNVLLMVKVPVMNHYLCTLSYSGKADITSNQLCAGGQIGKDSCGGDSGGPLMSAISVNAPPRYFIIGLVSFGTERCGESESPGVYTLVQKYLKWILDNVHA